VAFAFLLSPPVAEQTVFSIFDAPYGDNFYGAISIFSSNGGRVEVWARAVLEIRAELVQVAWNGR